MKVIFIVGVGRSGTSLLQSMLSSNSQVIYLPETSFFRRYVVKGALDSRARRFGYESVKKTLCNDKNLGRTGVPEHAIMPGTHNEKGLLDLAIYQGLLNQFAGGGKNVVGDKDPRLIEWLHALECSFGKKVYVINMIRDPRDVLVSKKKASWSRKGHVWKHIFANRVQFRLGYLNGKKTFGYRYHDVVYEDLISRPGCVLTDICRTLDIPFEESMLSFGEEAKRLVSKDEVSWKKETFGPLLDQNKEKWRSELSAREIRITELCCAEAIEMGHYQLSGSEQRISFKDRLWITLGVFVIKTATKPYIIYRNVKVAAACRKIKSSATES